MLAATGLNTPALFGFWSPRLLMPQELLARLTDQELRHVFLHELLHLRRGDVLVNWAMIFLRAMHWFNPAVWLAFRRLRADQELACDAAVMSRLDAPERRDYGATLIKLLEDFSAQALCPGVVPFVTNKQVIKRRISMIAKFKPAGRLAMWGAFAIVGLLGIVTFTRASQGPGARQTPGELPSMVPTSAGNQPQADDGPAQAFLKAMRDQDERIRAQEHKVDQLRREFGIMDSPDPASLGPRFAPEQQASMLQLSNIKVQAEMDATKQETQLTMLKQMKSADAAQFKNLLPRVTSDPILVQLLQELLQVDSQLSYQLATMGAEHPDVKKNAELKGKLEAQIKEQVAAIMQAQEVAVETSRAVARNAGKQMAELKAQMQALVSDSRPYWEAKTELDRIIRMREVLDLRKAQEQMDFRTPNKPANNLETALPTATAPLRVVVRSDGSIRLGSSADPVTLEQLKAAFAKEHEKNPQVGLILRSDSSVSYSAIKDILDAAQKAGITSVGLATDSLDNR
jgi:biopolymer transport protein ExbD